MMSQALDWKVGIAPKYETKPPSGKTELHLPGLKVEIREEVDIGNKTTLLALGGRLTYMQPCACDGHREMYERTQVVDTERYEVLGAGNPEVVHVAHFNEIRVPVNMNEDKLAPVELDLHIPGSEDIIHKSQELGKQSRVRNINWKQAGGLILPIQFLLDNSKKTYSDVSHQEIEYGVEIEFKFTKTTEVHNHPDLVKHMIKSEFDWPRKNQIWQSRPMQYAALINGMCAKKDPRLQGLPGLQPSFPVSGIKGINLACPAQYEALQQLYVANNPCCYAHEVLQALIRVDAQLADLANTDRQKVLGNSVKLVDMFRRELNLVCASAMDYTFDDQVTPSFVVEVLADKSVTVEAKCCLRPTGEDHDTQGLLKVRDISCREAAAKHVDVAGYDMVEQKACLHFLARGGDCEDGANRNRRADFEAQRLCMNSEYRSFVFANANASNLYGNVERLHLICNKLAKGFPKTDAYFATATAASSHPTSSSESKKDFKIAGTCTLSECEAKTFAALSNGGLGGHAIFVHGKSMEKIKMRGLKLEVGILDPKMRISEDTAVTEVVNVTDTLELNRITQIGNLSLIDDQGNTKTIQVDRTDYRNVILSQYCRELQQKHGVKYVRPCPTMTQYDNSDPFKTDSMKQNFVRSLFTAGGVVFGCSKEKMAEFKKNMQLCSGVDCEVKHLQTLVQNSFRLPAANFHSNWQCEVFTLRREDMKLSPEEEEIAKMCTRIDSCRATPGEVKWDWIMKAPESLVKLNPKHLGPVDRGPGFVNVAVPIDKLTFEEKEARMNELCGDEDTWTDLGRLGVLQRKVP
tara:strand:+ start:662 stop:3073 length:2412 start_codon:yes stop_codon:yes gene_type:complete